MTDGSDLIFVTGAPGSKWSAIAHVLSYATGVNNSDIAEHRRQGSDDGSPAMHFGNYFGPGMEFGKDFDRLGDLSADRLAEEFARPYRQLGGIRLLKSHLFSRDLEHLRAAFPGARFLLVHRPDDACLTWWREAGGFRLSFPDYSWYEDTENMRAQIAEDNAGISAFAAANGRRLVRHRSIRPILSALGLSYDASGIAARAADPWEQQFGLGDLGHDDFLAHADATARLAHVAVVAPARA